MRIPTEPIGSIPPEKQPQLIAAHRGGVGFGGIRERLRQLGGTLEIQSNGNGTVITAILNSGLARQRNEEVTEMLTP
jgi:signal transduction histidine kinase